MFRVEIVERIFTSFHIVNYTLCKDIIFPSITKSLNQTGLGVIYLKIEYRIKMQPHQLSHDINKPVFNLHQCPISQFQFFILKLDKSLCTSLIIRIKSILMIEIHKNVIR